MTSTSPTYVPEVLKNIKAQFPALQQNLYGNKPLVYLDNAATTQKPQVVIDNLVHYYQCDNANVHRATHALAGRATEALENTRFAVSQFINSAEKEEVIFTSGTTASINLVASSYGQAFIEEGDEILISHMEHHANIVPWQMVAQRQGAQLKVIPITDQGELVFNAVDDLLSEKTKLVAITYVSNNLGTINPIKALIKKAHAVGAIVFVDAAQAAPHIKLDVQDLDCDFLAFSSHKLYGPTGVGILYGKRTLLAQMPPYQGGGEMIKEVTLQHSTYNDLPYKFEAGTANISNIIGLKTALEFVQNIGWSVWSDYEQRLASYAQKRLGQLGGIQLIGTAPHKIGVISFNVVGLHAWDVGMLLDAQGIAVRTGHGCAQPLMQRFGIEGLVRASLAIYNTFEEIDFFVEKLEKIVKKYAS